MGKSMASYGVNLRYQGQHLQTVPNEFLIAIISNRVRLKIVHFRGAGGIQPCIQISDTVKFGRNNSRKTALFNAEWLTKVAISFQYALRVCVYWWQRKIYLYY